MLYVIFFFSARNVNLQFYLYGLKIFLSFFDCLLSFSGAAYILQGRKFRGEFYIAFGFVLLFSSFSPYANLLPYQGRIKGGGRGHFDGKRRKTGKKWITRGDNNVT